MKSKILSKVIKKFMDFKIGTKIILYYLIVLFFSMSVSTLLYQKINEKLMSDKVGDVSQQTISSISTNLDLLIGTVNNYSKMLMSNETIQTVLSNESSDVNINYNNQRIINRYLTEFINFNSLISSMYVFNNNGNKYYADKASFKDFGLKDIKEAPWYNDLVDKKGGYILKLNGGGLVNQTSTKYISLIRVINNIDTQEPIGFLVINISDNEVLKSYEGVGGSNSTTILLKDENNRDIAQSQDIYKLNYNSILENLKWKPNNTTIIKVNGNQYLVSYLKYQFDWKIYSIMPFKELSKQWDVYGLINFVVILINGILAFLGLIFISRLITRPIQKLVKSMQVVENGQFREVEIATGNDEIGKLKDVYNVMIREIQKLINDIIEEHKVKRKAELNVLQAQIKPHFLYNSFDAISSLALSGRVEEVYALIKALGSFYRTSLSNGKEVITVGEELETVKSYLTIQKIRYGDMFSVNFDIDERTYQYKILKLVLQPLVENAIYHGIKCKGQKGNILIKSIYDKDCIKLVVQDDGVGMTEDQVLKIKKIETQGIGLRSTIERLRIFYGIENIFDIESESGKGTIITITIPVEVKDNDK